MPKALPLKNDPVWNRMLALADKRDILVYIIDREIAKKHRLNGFYAHHKDDGKFIVLFKHYLANKHSRYELLSHELGHAITMNERNSVNFLVSPPNKVAIAEKLANTAAARLLWWVKKGIKKEII